jgi:hypothetical protein
MVSVKDLPAIAQDAIRANFAIRNARVFDTPSRHLRRRATQRQKIREWAAVLRIVRDPAMAECVQQAIKGAGPLMAHDLRRRIIYAGLESKFASLGR